MNLTVQTFSESDGFKKCVHIWPTELPPPKTMRGVSESFFPVDALGAGIPSPCGTRWYSPTYDVERTNGMVAASS